ncbi:hypothetical protein CGLAU_00370 [Corynebacterium glaucum]|uniref:Uncharacterized protein n=1 Tax=Corynebacterium glaucum TaxID=187491 RepID=A0A1Q2HTA5_9CORY|nr:hypothetical protein CGLAU_00370 [Corynebacterium glaucum]WJZ06599.1 hypothetical protein CGLAUT_00385 [Corynebacterium glaucum]
MEAFHVIVEPHSQFGLRKAFEATGDNVPS